MSEVKHYQDSHDNEIDAIITLPDGRWAAVEVKRLIAIEGVGGV